MTKMPGRNSTELRQRYSELTSKNPMEVITSVPPVIVIFLKKKNKFAELDMECKTAIYLALFFKLGKKRADWGILGIIVHTS